MHDVKGALTVSYRPTIQQKTASKDSPDYLLDHFLTGQSIDAGFRKAGISPFSRDKLLKLARKPDESPLPTRRPPAALQQADNTRFIESKGEEVDVETRGYLEVLRPEPGAALFGLTSRREGLDH